VSWNTLDVSNLRSSKPSAIERTTESIPDKMLIFRWGHVPVSNAMSKSLNLYNRWRSGGTARTFEPTRTKKPTRNTFINVNRVIFDDSEVHMSSEIKGGQVTFSFWEQEHPSKCTFSHRDIYMVYGVQSTLNPRKKDFSDRNFCEVLEVR
jgi:hypothetical protein